MSSKSEGGSFVKQSSSSTMRRTESHAEKTFKKGDKFALMASDEKGALSDALSPLSHEQVFKKQGSPQVDDEPAIDFEVKFASLDGMKEEEHAPIIVEPYRIKGEEEDGDSGILKGKKLEFDSQASSSLQ